MRNVSQCSDAYETHCHGDCSMRQHIFPQGNQLSDDELMTMVQKGHRDSFAEIFKRHSMSVFRYAFSLTTSMTDAQDLTQEVFLKAYAQRMCYRKMGIMKKWLFAICRNLQIDQHRRRIVRPVPVLLKELPDNAATTHGEKGSQNHADFFSHPLVGEFPSDVKEVLFLRIVEDLSYQEIAELTDKSAEALRQIFSRALRAMRNKGEVADADLP